MASHAMSPGQPAKRPTASQYSTRKERAALQQNRNTPAKTPVRKKSTPKVSTKSKKAIRRGFTLPRIVRKSGQTVLVVPLPRNPIAPFVAAARVGINTVEFGLRGLSYLPQIGMRGLSATFFFGAVAYALVPSALTVLRAAPGFVGDIFRGGAISSTFSPEVQRWSGEIATWSAQYNLDPNLMATVMQIESCGHPTISSYAGAQGLFQVMPFHFADGESMTDPDTNAMRGAGVLNECLRWSDGDVRGALACYNGGPSLISKPTDQWPDQTQRYVVWGEGIYADAKANADSATLDAWLRAGGSGLCNASANVSK